MRKLDAYSTYLILEGSLALCLSLIFTINMVYQVQVAQLNPFQLVLVGTVLEAAVFIFEVPTGVIADVYGRRRSIVIGMLLIGCGFVVEGSIPRPESILLAQVILGIGFTFISGATEAWISDEIGEAQAGSAFLRATQVAQIGDLVGIPISVALAALTLQLPIVTGGVLIVLLGLFLMAFMPERGFVPVQHARRGSMDHMSATFRNGLRTVRGRPRLVTLLCAIAIYAAFTEGFDRLWTPHLLDNFVLPTIALLPSVTWFGILRAGGAVLALSATEWVRRRVDTANHDRVARALLVINGLLMASVVAYGVAADFVMAFVVLLGIQPLRRMNGPLVTAWVNRRLESSVRATVISMSAQVDALGQIFGGPLLGAIALLATTRVEMVVAGLALVPVLWLYARTITTRPVMETQALP